MLETHCKVVDENVNLQETALNLKNASNSNVYLFAEKELVVKMLTARQGTTELNAHALPISLVMDIPDVIQNVQNMTIVPETRLVWNLNAETHAENQIQMCAVKEQIAKSKIINPSAHVQEDTPVIHSKIAASSQEKIFVNQIPVEMEQHVSLVTIVVDQTDQSAPAHQEHEGTHWENVPRVNANTMMNVEVKEPVTILDAQIPVPMHVAKVPNVELVIMALFARVQGVILEIQQLPAGPIEIAEIVVIDLAANVEAAMSLELLDTEDSSKISYLHSSEIITYRKLFPHTQIKQP